MMKTHPRLATAALAALAMTILSTSVSAESSTFQNSCKHIKLNTDSYRAWLSAECKTINGNYIQSSVMIKGLINNDGILQYSSTEGTSFQKNCRNMRLQWDIEKIRLYALCRKRSGHEIAHSIELLNIENRNGTLVNKSK